MQAVAEKTKEWEELAAQLEQSLNIEPPASAADGERLLGEMQRQMEALQATLDSLLHEQAAQPPTAPADPDGKAPGSADSATEGGSPSLQPGSAGGTKKKRRAGAAPAGAAPAGAPGEAPLAQEAADPARTGSKERRRRLSRTSDTDGDRRISQAIAKGSEAPPDLLQKLLQVRGENFELGDQIQRYEELLKAVRTHLTMTEEEAMEIQASLYQQCSGDVEMLEEEVEAMKKKLKALQRVVQKRRDMWAKYEMLEKVLKNRTGHAESDLIAIRAVAATLEF